jgi:hypothetical protein
MTSIAKTLAVLVLGLGLRVVSAAGSRGGNLDFFSDDQCQDRIQAENAPIPLDVCMPASPLGQLSRSFRVDQKPYCTDGSRPSLLFFQDCACTDGIANYIPNANYGDYGNGSCQAMWGGEYLMFALSCGEFKAPVRSVISFAATFPAPPSSTTKPVGCPALGSGASATGGAGAAASGGGDNNSGTATSGSVTATPTGDSSSSSSQQSAGNSSSSPASTTGTRTKVVQATSVRPQTSATTTSAANGRYYEMGTMYWVGYAGIFGVVSFLTL